MNRADIVSALKLLADEVEEMGPTMDSLCTLYKISGGMLDELNRLTVRAPSQPMSDGLLRKNWKP
jgi:hypothetical protein